MATAAQKAANRENAKHSTGPKSEAGKEASSQNNFRHGLSGHAFVLLEWESEEGYDVLREALKAEHQPQTPTEHILVEKMLQAHWLGQRAQTLLTREMYVGLDTPEAHKAAASYTRYQAHHERLFQRALKDLLTLRAERRKAQIGFESQQRAQAQETRREEEAKRKTERHTVDIETRKTRLEREQSLAIARAIDTTKKMEGFLPPDVMAKLAA